MGSPTWTDWFHNIHRVKEMATAARLIAGMRADEIERLNARNLSGINDATLRHAIRQYYFDGEDLLGWIDSGLDRVRSSNSTSCEGAASHKAAQSWSTCALAASRSKLRSTRC